MGPPMTPSVLKLLQVTVTITTALFVIGMAYPLEDDGVNAVMEKLDRQLPTCPRVLPATDRPSGTTSRVVGGAVPRDDSAAHMVAFVRNGNIVCSGSLISRMWAITAAHCPISPFVVAAVGGRDVSRATTLRIANVYAHPSYQPIRHNSAHDVLLVRLHDAAPTGSRFVHLNVNSSFPPAGAYARVAGYGRVLAVRRNAGRMLRETDIPVVAFVKCRRDYRRANLYLSALLRDRLQLCAGLDRGGCDACQGDSGGPLTVPDGNGNVVQIGVVSFGKGCAQARIPGVYTRMSAATEWIDQIGAKYTASNGGMTILSDGSAAAANTGGFSVGSLSPVQSIVVVSAAVVTALAALSILGVMVSRHIRQSSRGDGDGDGGGGGGGDGDGGRSSGWGGGVRNVRHSPTAPTRPPSVANYTAATYSSVHGAPRIGAAPPFTDTTRPETTAMNGV